ncbi:hypothetical protein [Bacillus cereus]|nr:hypothetical protein [Bacillus cereus]
MFQVQKELAIYEMIGTHDLGPAGAIVHTFAILNEHFIEEQFLKKRLS